MMPTLKSEFKKLLTIRSTYIVILIALGLTVLVIYLSTGPVVYEEQVVPTTSEQQVTDIEAVPVTEKRVSHDLHKDELFLNIQDSVPVVAIFIAIVVVLLMGHEFRHNTIAYTLTASRSRSRVLAAKITAAVVFTLVASLLTIGVIVAATYATISIKDLNLPPQDFNWLYIIGRQIAYCLGFSLISLAIITLVRNLTAGIVAIFILPTIDNIVAAILSGRDIEPTRFLPFSALGRIGNVAADLTPQVAHEGGSVSELLSVTLPGAFLVVGIYLVGLWAVSWYLFLRRDATA